MAELLAFRDIIQADLYRAARLIVRVQGEIDTQWRLATPAGDYHLALTLPPSDAGRQGLLDSLDILFVWKEVRAYTVAAELKEPDAVMAVGVSLHEAAAAVLPIAREPKPWTLANFGALTWLPSSSIDPALLALLPRAPRPLSPKEVSSLQPLFGKDGRFPLVHLPSSEVRGI